MVGDANLSLKSEETQQAVSIILLNDFAKMFCSSPTKLQFEQGNGAI